MNTTELIAKAIRCCGSQSALALAMGVSQPFISQLVRGEKRLTAEKALMIEIATEGEVTAAQLLPEIFDQIKAIA